jgi:hypothetical protein
MLLRDKANSSPKSDRRQTQSQAGLWVGSKMREGSDQMRANLAVSTIPHIIAEWRLTAILAAGDDRIIRSGRLIRIEEPLVSNEEQPYGGN